MRYLTFVLLFWCITGLTDGQLPSCEEYVNSAEFPYCNSALGISYDNYITPYTHASEMDPPQNGWWWNPDLSGEGVFIEIQPSSIAASGYFLFGSLYTYDENGKALWLTFSGAYEPNLAFERWHQVDMFKVLSEFEVAPEGTLLGQFSGELSKVTGGTCLRCAQRASSGSVQSFGAIDITWTNPYAMHISIAGVRGFDLVPLDVNGGDGSFLTDGVWRVEALQVFDGAFAVPEGQDYYPILVHYLSDSYVAFEPVDMRAVYAGVTSGPDPLSSFGMRDGANSDALCYKSSLLGSYQFMSSKEPRMPNASWTRVGYGSNNLRRYVACYYPSDGSLRMIDMYWPDGVDVPPVNWDYLNFLTYLPKGDVENFNAFPTASLQSGRLGRINTGNVIKDLAYSEHAIESMGMHISKVQEGGQSVRLMPYRHNSWFELYFNGFPYKSLRNDLDPDNELGDYGLIDGFYTPVPYDKQTQKPFSGWYWDPDNGGWGMSYTIYSRANGNDFVFGSIYAFDETGEPRWYVFSGDYFEGEEFVATADEFENGTCYNCNTFQENNNTNTGFEVRINWQDKQALSMKVNAVDYNMRRFNYSENTLSGANADWLTEGKYDIIGIRIEGTFKAYHDGTRWRNVDRSFRASDENNPRPQYVFTKSTTGWDKMDTTLLKASELTRLRQTIGVSDEAVFYIQDDLYDEHFMNMMTPAEYADDFPNNDYGKSRFTTSVSNFNDIGWWNYVQDVGRLVLAYEPSSKKVKIVHLGGDDIKKYPNINNGSFTLMDEFFLFEGVLGTSADQHIQLYPVSCPPGICVNPSELDGIVYNEEFYKRNFLTMDKVRSYSENLARAGGYAEWCNWGYWRTKGYVDENTDPLTFIERAAVNSTRVTDQARCNYYYPDKADVWYTDDWYAAFSGQNVGFTEAYHVQ